MSRFAVVLLLFLVPTTARADERPGLQWVRTVWIDHTFTVERDYPNYEFYLLGCRSDMPAERLPLTPSNPVRVSGPGEKSRYKWALIYAVRKSRLAPFGDAPPPYDWFAENEGAEVVKLKTSTYFLYFSKTLLFTDNRERAEITYRIEVGLDGRLVKVSENAGNPWVKWGGWIVVGLTVLVGGACFGVWKVMRIGRLCKQ
jgi:hypothetical protein